MKRVFQVTWRDERKTVEALSHRQAIGMAIPEWDNKPLTGLTVTELVSVADGEKLQDISDVLRDWRNSDDSDREAILEIERILSR